MLFQPHVLHLVDHQTVEQLSPVNTLALALIALAGGVELRIETLRSVAKSLAVASLIQTVVVLIGMGAVFFLLAPFIPFAKDLELRPLLGVALLWGALCVTRSPSACMGILSQTRAKGPLATFSLGFIMLSDVVVVVMTRPSNACARANIRLVLPPPHWASMPITLLRTTA